MRIRIILLWLIFTPGVIFSQSKSYKRGVGYGYHSVADMNTASEGISWWYNWAARPDAAIRTTYPDYNVDFTPQAWNAAGISGVNAWVVQDDKLKYLLGFNEPNFKAQANMTPTQAAAAWPALQAIADQYGLKLVSPAVNYCGSCVSENGTTYSNPFDWLDDFFAACPNCRVDYIALHWYGGGNSIMGYIDDARKYGKPIWVTEFANWESGVTASSQRNYLAGTSNFLERDPDVYRYAWFIGRGDGENVYPYIDLYGASGEMTTLGQIYLDIPTYDSTQFFEIPGRIEAEEYYLQKGVFGEITNDVDGFMNIGYTENGDWLKYRVLVTESGNYAFTCRYAGTASGKFDVYLDSEKKASINTSNTGGWQNWKSLSVNVQLDAGEHILKLAMMSNGFNINWIRFDKGFAGIDDSQQKVLEASIYPNPVADKQFTIAFKNTLTAGLQIQLSDCAGRIVFSQQIQSYEGTKIPINLKEVNNIAKGIYTLRVKSGSSFLNQKIALF